MRIEFNRTGAERKELVKAISEITGAEAVYKFMPTCAYEISYFTVTKDGVLEFDDRADSEEIENLLEHLAQRGFEGTAPEAPEIATEMPDTAAESEAEELSEKAQTTEHKHRGPIVRKHKPDDNTAAGKRGGRKPDKAP